MDSAGTRGRKYPAYTTEELKKALAEGNPWLPLTADQIAAMTEEVARREAGLSAHYKVPQIT